MHNRRGLRWPRLLLWRLLHVTRARFQHDTGPLDKGHIYGSPEKHRKIGGTGHEKTRRPAIHVVLGRYEPKAGKEPKKPEKCARDTETERWRLKKKQREDKSERSDCDVAACVVVGVDDADRKLPKPAVYKWLGSALGGDGSEAIKSRAELAVAEPRQHYLCYRTDIYMTNT
ncbi:hypothetical protein C8R45DRAFT_1183233 [Mycena sanguinolenta]|nr:hypothetical protein C8R45DRAFT_1183233 [Mycena sanguinolenta]